MGPDDEDAGAGSQGQYDFSAVSADGFTIMPGPLGERNRVSRKSVHSPPFRFKYKQLYSGAQDPEPEMGWQQLLILESWLAKNELGTPFLNPRICLLPCCGINSEQVITVSGLWPFLFGTGIAMGASSLAMEKISCLPLQESLGSLWLDKFRGSDHAW
jgi:hypothetical protein